MSTESNGGSPAGEVRASIIDPGTAPRRPNRRSHEPVWLLSMLRPFSVPTLDAESLPSPCKRAKLSLQQPAYGKCRQSSLALK